MAYDAIRNHLSTRLHYDWDDCPELPEANSARLAMRELCAEFNTKYDAKLSELVKELHLSRATVFPEFVAVTNSMYSDGIQWGRIVCLYAFSCRLAEVAVMTRQPQLVSSVAEWLAVVTVRTLQPWVFDHDGWVGSTIVCVFITCFYF